LAKHSARIIELARLGAERRLDELHAEIAALMKSFPHLSGRRRRTAGSAAQPVTERAGKRRRRRKAMSAAARKAVSVRMRKYWADRRKAKAS
jgi:hypothetical protein